MVSIHAPTRGATLDSQSFLPGGSRFQSTHPHGVRRRLNLIFAKAIVFQSTHPHGVRRRVLRTVAAGALVSIHAPTRGATPTFPRAVDQKNVSIHAPTRGATCDEFLTLHYANWFQSTHPHGVRQVVLYDISGTWTVSIHAPTRGATVYSANV